jgi:hypothetical protein
MPNVLMDLDVTQTHLNQDVDASAEPIITEAALATEKSTGGVDAKPERRAEIVRKWKHPIKGKR